MNLSNHSHTSTKAPSKWKRIVPVIVMTALIFSMFAAQPARAVSTSSIYLLLYVEKQDAFINNEPVKLDVPAKVINGKMYVPAKFLGDTLGFDVDYDGPNQIITMNPGGVGIRLDLKNKVAVINEVEFVQLDTVATIVNGRTLVKLTWIMDYLKAKYNYNQELNRVEVQYVRSPGGVTPGQGENSNPVAKFTLDKTQYRKGEKINYIDLSYDVDSEAIAKYTWTGKEDAFFETGLYKVTLQVEDRHGAKSNVYSRYVSVGEETYMTKLEYNMHYKPVTEIFKLDTPELKKQFANLPQLAKTVEYDSTRPLLVSDSPENITEKGILYQDTVNGKARLYANHVNGLEQNMQFKIVATNDSDKPVTIKTTRKGEVYPSYHVMLFGRQATMDFLMDNAYSPNIVIPPGQTQTYALLPTALPGQGMNLLYDIETDGPVTMSFAATDPGEDAENVLSYPKLPYVANIRGTFPQSEIAWNIDGSKFAQISAVTIGDGKTDMFVKGNDPLRQIDTVNYGNYGVVYKIHIENPRKMALMIMAKGGVFNGSFKINGKLVRVPVSGIITPFDGMEVLARTMGLEKSLDLEFSPTAGSYFPIDLIFYPLDDK